MLVSSPHRYWQIARLSVVRIVPVFLVATAMVAARHVVPLHLAASSVPVSILGTVVAFYVGFKNNQAYDRFWEGRKAWGSIVNTSRTIDSVAVRFTTDQPMPSSHPAIGIKPW